MPRTNTIVHRGSNTKETIIFEDEELDTLENFCTEFSELRMSSIFSEKMPSKFSMSWSKDSGVVEYQSDPIDKEAWRAAMHLLRPLTLSSSKKKAIRFHSVC